jgi:hypothetical protein
MFASCITNSRLITFRPVAVLRLLKADFAVSTACIAIHPDCIPLTIKIGRKRKGK